MSQKLLPFFADWKVAPRWTSSRAAVAQRCFLFVQLQHAVIVLNAPASGTNASQYCPWRTVFKELLSDKRRGGLLNILPSFLCVMVFNLWENNSSKNQPELGLPASSFLCNTLWSAHTWWTVTSIQGQLTSLAGSRTCVSKSSTTATFSQQSCALYYIWVHIKPVTHRKLCTEQ